MNESAMNDLGYSEEFLYAVKRTLDREGLWSDNPKDTGGKTKYGITEKLAKRYGYQTIQQLTLDDAIEIYEDEFWTAGIDGDEVVRVSNKYVAYEIFDTAVNAGPNIAITIAQKALRLLHKQIKVDGVMGAETVRAIKSIYPAYWKHFIYAMNGFQFEHYVTITHTRAANEEFIAGWMLRLETPFDDE